MESGKTQETENTLVLSFYAVRQALGAIGLMLPTVLLAYGWLSGRGIEPSISDFYHTAMGDVLVGALCAIGIFLITYKGYKLRPGEWIADRWVSRIAGIAAILVALFPATLVTDTPCVSLSCPITGITGHPEIIHFGSAFIFFVCLAIFCLVLFTRTDPEQPVDKRKSARNTIYRGCGWIIVAMLLLLCVLIGMSRFGSESTGDAIHRADLVFWAESVAVWAFAISWLAKGRTLTILRMMLR